MYQAFLGLFLITTCFGKKPIDYCQINKDHILCGADEPIDNIKNIRRFLPTTDKDRYDLLDKINKMRDVAASGNFRIVGSAQYPSAADMYQLEWCDVCEKAALNHLKRCNLNTYRSCCNCMNTGEMDLFTATRKEIIEDVRDFHFNLTSIFHFLHNYHNEAHIPFECVRNFTDICMEGASGFHFSLLNAKQVKIGCAYAECIMNGTEDVTGIFICITNLNYILDMKGKFHYTSNEPASLCPKPQSSTSKKYNHLCKCRNITGCLIQPAKLSSECTNRKNVTSTTLPSTTQIFGTQPRDFNQIMDLETFEVQIPAATTTTKRTTKAVTGSGGGGDAAGVKRLEDGDNFALMFMMIWLLFIY